MHIYIYILHMHICIYIYIYINPLCIYNLYIYIYIYIYIWITHADICKYLYICGCWLTVVKGDLEPPNSTATTLCHSVGECADPLTIDPYLIMPSA